MYGIILTKMREKSEGGGFMTEETKARVV